MYTTNDMNTETPKTWCIPSAHQTTDRIIIVVYSKKTVRNL
jgi:hypothetical protein